MKKKDLVDIVLENCEVYGFKREDTSIYLDGLCKHYFGNTECLDKVQHACILIDKKAKAITYDEDTDKDWWDRITRGQDITQICIDGKTYFVDWDDDTDYESDWYNKYQTTYEEKHNRVIIISKTRKTTDDF